MPNELISNDSQALVLRSGAMSVLETAIVTNSMIKVDPQHPCYNYRELLSKLIYRHVHPEISYREKGIEIFQEQVKEDIGYIGKLKDEVNKFTSACEENAQSRDKTVATVTLLTLLSTRLISAVSYKFAQESGYGTKGRNIICGSSQIFIGTLTGGLFSKLAQQSFRGGACAGFILSALNFVFTDLATEAMSYLNNSENRRSNQR